VWTVVVAVVVAAVAVAAAVVVAAAAVVVAAFSASRCRSCKKGIALLISFNRRPLLVFWGAIMIIKMSDFFNKQRCSDFLCTIGCI
jgi:hypothetical protein